MEDESDRDAKRSSSSMSGLRLGRPGNSKGIEMVEGGSMDVFESNGGIERSRSVAPRPRLSRAMGDNEAKERVDLAEWTSD